MELFQVEESQSPNLHTISFHLYQYFSSQYLCKGTHSKKGDKCSYKNVNIEKDYCVDRIV